MNEILYSMSNGVEPQVILLPVLIVSVVSFFIGVLYLVSIIKLYSKAGKPGWAALIPIYNIIVLMDIANLSYKNLLLILIPFIGVFIFMIKLYIGVAKAFNKGIGYALGLIFLPIVFLPLLAFSKSANINGSILSGSDQNEIQVNGSTDIINNTQSNIEQFNNFVQPESINNIQNGNISDLNVNNAINNTQSNIEQFNNFVQPENLDINQNNNMTELDVNNIVNNNLQSNIEQFDNFVQPESINNIQNSNISDLNVNNVINNTQSNVEQFNNFVQPESINNIQNSNISDLNVNSAINNTQSNIEQFNTVQPENLDNSSINQNNDLSNFNNNNKFEELDISNIYNTTGNNFAANDEVVNGDVLLNNSENSSYTLNAVQGTSSVMNTNNSKICRNCGAELPKIVTICPGCGTDNE